jgi:hypothetical protein
MFLGLVNGWVEHEGEEPILWAFACMCGGLLIGTAYPHRPAASEGGDDAKLSGLMAEGVEGDERRS